MRWGLTLGVGAWITVRLWTRILAQSFFVDDAFISFRYARNLGEGHGLVWNPAEYVEGYTNLLWVLLMALTSWIGAAPETTSLVLGSWAGAGTLAVVTWYAGRRTQWSPWAWLPALWLVHLPTFTAWCSGGLETMLFTLLLTAGTLRGLEELDSPEKRPWSALLAWLAYLTRPEGAMLLAGLGGLHLYRAWRQPGHRMRCTVWLTLSSLGVAGHMAWRLIYYRAWLPNTFHAKVNGTWWEQGGQYLALFHEDYHAGWWLPLLLLLAWRRRGIEVLLPVGLIFVQLAYVWAIGGDRFEYRFLVPLLPLVGLLIAQCLEELTGQLQAARLRSGAALAAAGIWIVASWWGGTEAYEEGGMRHDVESVRFTGDYAQLRIDEGRTLREAIDLGLLRSDLVFAAAGAGAIPYYTGWPTIDVLGLSDATVAHSETGERSMIAHEHYASQEYLERRKVVVFDALNALVHSSLSGIESSKKAANGTWSLHNYQLHEGLMVFATTLTRSELADTFDLSQLDNEVPSGHQENCAPNCTQGARRVQVACADQPSGMPCTP
ncbi:MAG: hypothetical protein QGG40_05900 [Myxococcota bacterium]|nr:hypothetical protein [Myxococcota bacterium]